MTHELLRQLLTYNASTGLFHWKPRDRSSFASQAAYTRFHLKHAGQQAGTVDKYGYVVITIGPKKYSAARLAWLYHYGSIDEAKDIDHKDGNMAFNAIANLRQASHQQNMMNRKTHKQNLSGHKNIRFQNGYWIIRIMSNGKSHYRGMIPTLEEAIEIQRSMATEHHGEFSR